MVRARSATSGCATRWPTARGQLDDAQPSGERVSIYDAAERYQEEGVPLVILAGSEYGTGSSRDWAAKGTLLLGIRAVLAESYERIHRSNLVGMGILPLELPQGETQESLGLTGRETYTCAAWRASGRASASPSSSPARTARRGASRRWPGSTARPTSSTYATAASCPWCCAR